MPFYWEPSMDDLPPMKRADYIERDSPGTKRCPTCLYHIDYSDVWMGPACTCPERLELLFGLGSSIAHTCSNYKEGYTSKW